MKEEEKEIIQEEKARRHKNKKADKRKVRTGGFVDEIDEEDVTGYSENGKKAAIQQTAQTAASEAHAELKKEIAAATSEEADMLSRLEMAERTVEENRKPHPAKSKRFRKRKRSRLPLEALRCRLIPQRSLQAV